MSKMSTLREFWEFIKVRKKFFLVHVVFFLLLLSLLMIFAQSSAVAPFIYTLF